MPRSKESHVKKLEISNNINTRNNSKQSAAIKGIDLNELSKGIASQLSTVWISQEHEEKARLDFHTIDFDLSLFIHYAAILQRQNDKKKKSASLSAADNFGNTLRGTQLDGYFNRSTGNSSISPAFFRPVKAETSDKDRELEQICSAFYRLNLR